MALEKPEKTQIIHLTVEHDFVVPEVLPFEIGNALTAMMKKRALEADALTSALDTYQLNCAGLTIRSALERAFRFNIYAYDALFY